MWYLLSNNSSLWQISLDEVYKKIIDNILKNQVKGIIFHMHSSRPICEPCALATSLEINGSNSFAERVLNYCKDTYGIDTSNFIITYSCRQENTKPMRYVVGYDGNHKGETDFTHLVNS